jgi:hypothetical protein
MSRKGSIVERGGISCLEALWHHRMSNRSASTLQAGTLESAWAARCRQRILLICTGISCCSSTSSNTFRCNQAFAVFNIH